MNGGIKIRRIIALMTAFLILVSGAGSGTAIEIIIDPGSSIQTAIDNATSGDIIIIKPGTYTENVKISTDSLTIRSASGNPDDTMIRAKSSTNVIFVDADNVKISGIKAAAATVESASGICLSGCNNCVIEKNKLTVNGRGIYIVNSRGCTVSGNSIVNNGYYGIVLGSSSNNIISGNTVTNSGRGIYLGNSDDNIVSGNIVTLNSVLGYYSCSLCDRNRIYNNHFNNTEIFVKSGSGNVYNTTKTAGTNIIGGPYIGGNYWGKPDGTGFSDTPIDNDRDGISDSAYSLPGSSDSDYLPLVYLSNLPEPVLPVADFSSDVTSGNAPLTVKFTDKSAGDPTEWNWDFGDGTDSTDKNPVHIYTPAGTYTVKLTVSNADGAASKEGAITVLQTSEPVSPVADFTSSVTSGTAPIEVSFTDTSTGSPIVWNWDFGDGATSTEQNPIHTYSLAGTYVVSLTASNANGKSSKTSSITVLQIPELILPVADFSANVTNGYAPLSVLFTDLSQDAAGISWDFDNDGLAEASSRTAVYVYTSPGTYTVNLVATNEYGAASKIATITVLEESSSSGGSSSGEGSSSKSGGSSKSGSSSGGGGGGSPEPARNVQAKELSQVFITNGREVKFDFTKNATCVLYLSFDAKKTAGKVTTTVEDLKNKSALVSELPEGEIYKSFNVWVGNSGYAAQENIENPAICFRVEKAWIQDKKIDPASISLKRYSNKTWEHLPASLSGEDDELLYFTAEVPGFSFFAIAGETKGLSEESVIERGPEKEIRSIEREDVENTGAEAGQNSEEKSIKMPGFGAGCGIICIFAVFLYKREQKS